MSANTFSPTTHDEYVKAYYRYVASTDGAIALTALFGFAFLVGCVTCYRYPKTKYMLILPFSAALETIGYGTRYQSIQHPNLAPYVTSVVAILLAPIFLALINYIVVSKFIFSTGKKILYIPPSIISYVFFASDFIGLVVQAIGGSYLASAKVESAIYTCAAFILHI